MMDRIIAGIDVSKQALDIHLRPTGESFVLARDDGGITELADRLLAGGVDLVAVEATGGLEGIVVAALAAAGLAVVVVNPGQVRSFARALGTRAKTDPIDAFVIARFAEATAPAIRPLADTATRQLAELVARRRQIVAMLVAEKQRLPHAAAHRVRHSLARLIAALEAELTDIDRDVDDAVRGSPMWREAENLLSSVPGVGPITSRTLLAELPEIGTLDRKRIAALAGLAPFTRQSGSWRGKSFIGGGRAPVRAALFIATLTAVRCNPLLRAFYRHLLDAGKPKMLALVATARKLLTILNAIIRTKTPWITQNP